MAEIQTKRHREEEETQKYEEETKRHKSYNQIISILEEDEIEPTHEDSSSIFTTLQQELYSHDFPPLLSPASDYGPAPQPQISAVEKQQAHVNEVDEENVIRHLLEASDDELGIPANRVDGADGGDFEVSFGDGLWELEDEAANYYTLLQSELFR